MIGRICPRCKSTFSQATAQCPRCSIPTKFKVRVRTAQGWRTGQASSISEASRLEADFCRVFGCTRNQSPSHGLPGEPGGPSKAARLAPSVGAIWLKYLAYVSDRNASWSDDLGRYRLHIEPRLGHLSLSEVTPGMVLECLPAHRSPATRHRVLALLKRMFNWSIKMGFFDVPNPCTKVDPPRYDNSRQRYLSETEKEALLAALETDRNDFAVRAIKFMWLTGRRRGEVLALEWPDVDLERGLVTFRKTKNGKIQTVPVNSVALRVLEESPRVSGLVFPCSSGRYFHTFHRTWCRIRKQAGLEDFRLHDLRHSFASVLASSGRVDIYTLQRLLGHSQITMTQRYAHLMPGALRDAAEVAVW